MHIKQNLSKKKKKKKNKKQKTTKKKKQKKNRVWNKVIEILGRLLYS